ncbi:major facilitator superfamily domain-containing protein [Schizophyllum amplum]|uniref:Major facilitator superfamily domain-containing protein n=1 Tax=Schizophyllum amplum TaxID=97359 RepID=A0A550CVV6_9AGAR|nr:major facilitator superfamily domain-containing protein [Auriculariopsis ampla]
MPGNDRYRALPSDEHGDAASISSTPRAPLLPARQKPASRIKSRCALQVSPDGAYTYSYGPSGLSGLLHNRYALLCAVVASIGGLSFGYDQGVIANILVMQDFVEEFPVTPLQKGILTAVLELGALIGALAAGVLADRYSRRHSIFVACVIFLIGSLFQCLAHSLFDLFVGRAVGGVAVGALSMLSPLYISEVSPPELRGSLMALEQFSIVLGCVLGFWTGFATRNIPGSLAWRIPLGVQIIPGLILAAGCLLLPPSPRLLVLLGEHERALESLRKLRGADTSEKLPGGSLQPLRGAEVEGIEALVEIEFTEMRVEATLLQRTAPDLAADASYAAVPTDAGDAARPENTAKASKGYSGALQGYGALFQEKYLERTMIGIMTMFFQQWVGINALLYYGPTLVASIGLQGEEMALLVSGGIGIAQFLAVLPAIAYIDRWGRRPLLRGGAVVMGCSHLLIALLVKEFSADWEDHRGAAWLAVGAIYVFTVAYGISIGPIGWVLPSEVFPLSVRSKGVALSTASNWLNNFLIGFITPELMAISPAATFGLFATASFAAYMWATYRVPETSGVALEEIGAMFHAGGSLEREEAELREQIERDLGLSDVVRRAAAALAGDGEDM